MDIGDPVQSSVTAPATERMVEPKHDSDYASRTGYDPDFLGLSVPMAAASNLQDLSALDCGSTTLA
ncbi:hypothetical protein A8B78_04200 [Jannaschia sp. EhC01]|nr:hypothetical protein A8B78_04200 [Jannaschia sp. EhC01]